MYMFSAEGAGAHRGPGRGVRRHRRARQRHARAADAVHRAGVPGIFKSTPEFSHSFQITFPTGGFGGMIVKPWNERERDIFPIQEELIGKLMGITGVRAPVFLPPALPSAGLFPVEFVIASTGPPRGAGARRRPAGAARPSRAASSPSRRSPTCASIRRRPRSCSTATRSPRWGSACSRSAPIWPPCWAATSSIASTWTGAATR